MSKKGMDLRNLDTSNPGSWPFPVKIAACVITGLFIIGLAWYFFVSRPGAADTVAASAAPLHRLLLHKYYVDELYDAVIVQPIKRLSTGFLWKGVDAGVIDGLVNGTGSFVGAGSSVLRRLQTGSVRVYAASVFLGVVMVLGYYMWRC